MNKYLLPLFLATSTLSYAEEQPADKEFSAISYITPYRILKQKDLREGTVELDDGSIWQVVSSYDNGMLNHWRIHDTLVISSNSGFFRSSDLYIYNERLRTNINVKLLYGPLANAPVRNQITHIDYANHCLHIQDHTGHTSFWRISPSDFYALQAWGTGQDIILGANTEWFTSYPYILVNVDRNVYIRGSLN